MGNAAHDGHVKELDAGAFRAHLMGLADQIRSIATNKIIEAYEKGEREQLEQIMREHNLNLYVEQPISIESYRSYLRDTYFMFVNSYFERGANLPDPDASVAPGTAVANICGEGALSRVANTEPNSASAQATMLANVDPSGGLLGNGMFQRISTINDKVGPWKSGAVDMFKEYFLPGIPAAINQQIIVAKVLRNVMGANQGMVALTRDDVDAIAHDTIAALEFSDGCCSGDNDSQTWLGIVGGVAAVIAGIATLPFTGGASTAAIVAGGFTILDGALDTYSAAEESRAQRANMPMGADTVEGILDNMTNAVNRAYEELDKGNTALSRDVLSRVDSYMAGNKAQFVSPRPAEFADATQQNVVDMVEGP